MENKLSCNVTIHEEVVDNKKMFVVNCTELGVSDFGETVDEALSNLKEGLSLLIEEFPEKARLLEKQEPLLLTRLFL
jgi:predicted RNase H-like HicB family nuclease